jgi:uncharacterized protein YjbJ (UPF0337 family)
MGENAALERRCHLMVVMRTHDALEEENKMDKDRMKGSATNVGGKIKEGAGNLTGDQKLKGEGMADQVKGKVQNAIGGIKDALKGK